MHRACRTANVYHWELWRKLAESCLGDNMPDDCTVRFSLVWLQAVPVPSGCDRSRCSPGSQVKCAGVIALQSQKKSTWVSVSTDLVTVTHLDHPQPCSCWLLMLSATVKNPLHCSSGPRQWALAWVTIWVSVQIMCLPVTIGCNASRRTAD